MRIFFIDKPGGRPRRLGRDPLRRSRSFSAVTTLVLGLTMATVGSASANAGAPLKAIPPGGMKTGIDGFAPNFYTRTNGNTTEAWVIAHHAYTPENEPRVSCIDLTSGGFCKDPNGKPTTWPKPLNTTPGPLGDGNTGDLATTQAPGGIVQTDLGARVLHFPALTTTPTTQFGAGSVGVGCLNMELQANCHYVPLAALTQGTVSDVRGISGLALVNETKIYGQLTDGRMACYDSAADAPCPGQPYATSSPPNNDRPGLGPSDYNGVLVAIRGKIYTVSNGLLPDTNSSPHLPTVSCFDPATNAPCAQWQNRTINDPNVYETLALFPSYNHQGIENGVCAVTTRRVPGVLVNCFDFQGNDALTPPNLASIFPTTGSSAVVFPPANPVVMGRQRSYFPFYTQDNVHKGAALCYDWNSQNKCVGFPNPLAHPTVNGGLTHDYGYAYNPQTDCVYGTGHFGFLLSFRPQNGAAGC